LERALVLVVIVAFLLFVVVVGLLLLVLNLRPRRFRLRASLLKVMSIEVLMESPTGRPRQRAKGQG
jgi:hypothetical protein